MKFDTLFEGAFELYETKYGNKYGDYRDFDKKYYADEPVAAPVAKDPTGPIVDTSGNIWCRQLKSVVHDKKFSESLFHLEPVWQAFVLKTLANFTENKVPIKPEIKHTISDLVWDIRHNGPSIKILFNIDGHSRVLHFRCVVLGYGKYMNKFTA